uniref:Uncharacterized protein n=1 Tax=Meloidogyne enterolobii TaxID=390850 RepID=A0A6V7ULU7_MELEN|nr:unnamed protein product [Meloidogyne enterolobii]
MKALHISRNIRWSLCSDSVSSENNYQIIQHDMTPFFKIILNATVPTLLYYGDTDSVCNFIMGQKFSEQLGLKLKTPKQAWLFNKQIGGFKTEYFGGLTFLTGKFINHLNYF